MLGCVRAQKAPCWLASPAVSRWRRYLPCHQVIDDSKSQAESNVKSIGKNNRAVLFLK